MNTIWWYIVAGTTISGLQLALGIVIGLWFRRSDRWSRPPGTADAKLARIYIQELAALTGNVSRGVNQHHHRINTIQHQLGSAQQEDSDSLTELVVGVMGELMRANQDLQSQLAVAETELQCKTSEIESHLSKSMTDELTGLPNRRAFENALVARQKTWQYQRIPFALMMIDIDHFKEVNDQYGHIAGDQVLCTVADTLKRSLRKPDLVTRFGGEEFAVLLPYTLLDDATSAARKVLVSVASAVTRFESHSLSVTISVGLAAVLDGETPTELIKRADLALYASKSGGRNCSHFHDGQACFRIAGAKLAASAIGPFLDEMSFDDSDELSPDLMAICSELRDRASELARETRARKEMRLGPLPGEPMK